MTADSDAAGLRNEKKSAKPDENRRDPDDENSKCFATR
jgi:hypothetical protein